jgi:hypothetical protein
MRKDVKMDIEWLTVQLFIGDEGVSEVEIDSDNHNKVRCSCKTFNNFAKCKHSRYVKERISNNDGHYSVYIPENVADETAVVAMTNPILWRDFILKHGQVEVL